MAWAVAPLAFRDFLPPQDIALSAPPPEPEVALLSLPQALRAAIAAAEAVMAMVLPKMLKVNVVHFLCALCCETYAG